MRVGFAWPCFDGTGFSQSGSLYVRALVAAGADVVCRAVRHNGKSVPPHPDVLPLLDKPGGSLDALVQHSLPPQFSHFAGPLNVGLFFPETAPLAPTWAAPCRLMDACFTACREHADTLAAAGLRSHVVPVPFDPAVLSEPFVVPPEMGSLEPYFTFYAVDEFVPRKNWGGLLRAFLGEFDPGEPVRLFCKTDRAAELATLARQVHAELGRAEAGSVAVCGRRFSDAEMLGLHRTADCYVTASHAEGWGLSAFAALAFGKTPVAPAHSAFRDYLDDQTAYPVPSRPSPCGGDPANGDLYGPARRWWEPDPLALRAALRTAYEDPEGRARKARLGPDSAARFDLVSAGRLFLEALHGSQDAVRPGPLAGGP